MTTSLQTAAAAFSSSAATNNNMNWDSVVFPIENKGISPPPKLPSLILLDRDGVVNEDVGAPGVIDKVQLVLTPNAGTAIGKLVRVGCKVVFVTNQSCVGKGLISHNDLQVIQEEIQHLLLQQDKDAKLDKIYSCTSTAKSGDYRMKPMPGMIQEACRDFGISPQDCIMIGDTLTDMQAASAGGVPLRILVSTGYGSRIMKGHEYNVLPQGIDKQQQQQENEEDENVKKSSISLPASILPLVYVENLSQAVSWLLGEL